MGYNKNEQFADLFNAVLFEGRQVIKPEEIDSDGSTVLEHRKYAKSINASRDNVKICKKSTKYGVELQTEPERLYHGFVLGLMVDLSDRYVPVDKIYKYGFAFEGKTVLTG